MNQLQETEFEVETLFVLIAEFAVRAEHDLQEAREVLFTELFSDGRDPVGFVLRDLQKGSALARDLGDDRVAQESDHLAREVRRVVAFDHEAIVRAGVERLRSKVEYTSLPAFLLPEPFTLPELQRAYEVVLGRPVDKSGFRTRMLAGGFLVEAGLVPRGTRRPPMGYRLASRDAPVVFPRTFGPRGAG